MEGGRGAMADKLPLISVVTPVRNEERYMVRFLDSLAQQTYPKEGYEILIADGGSIDRTLAVIREYQDSHPEQKIRLWERPGTGRESRLNFCIREARGAIVARVDAHSLVAPDYLLVLAQLFAEPPHPKVWVVGGPVRVSAEGFLQHVIGLAMQSRFGMGSISYRCADREGFVNTVQNASYDRRVFNEVGEFDENIGGTEDTDFHYRVRQAGYKVFMTPRLRFFYFPRRTVRGLFRQFMNYGRWRVRFFRKHKIRPPARYLLPLMFVLVGLVAPLFSLTSINVKWPVVLGACLYAMTGLYFALRDGGRTVLRFVPALLLLYLVMHTGYGIGMWVEIFRPGGRWAGGQARSGSRSMASKG